MSKDQRGGGSENKGHPSGGPNMDPEQHRGQATGQERGKPQNWDRGQGVQTTQGEPGAGVSDGDEAAPPGGR